MVSSIHTFSNSTLPPTAALSLSEDGADLILTFDAHSVFVPVSELGLQLIREILRGRRDERSRTVGTNGALTQALVDAWLKDNKVKRAGEIADLPELDLEGIDL